MPIRRDPRSPFWQYRFQIRGRIFFGSTKKTAKRDAEKIEAAEHERAKALIAQAEHARTSLRLDDVAGRWWTEHGQHLAGASNTWTLLGFVVEFLGKDKLVTEIVDDDVARLQAVRRGHRRNDGALISAFTVNHTVTTLRALFTRCKLWGVRFNHEPKWSKYLLEVPVERVRELSDDEAGRLDAAVRADYAPFFEFARVTGMRLKECVTLRWSEVDFGTRQIVKLGKRGKRVTKPITSEIREILWPLQGNHPEFVFTYVHQRDERGRVKGERSPLTYAGVQSYWKHLRRQSGVTGFRFHDYRHDYATKLLRETGNLRLVQKALGHASSKTTERYAHVNDSEVADAMERVAQKRKKPAARLKVV